MIVVKLRSDGDGGGNGVAGGNTYTNGVFPLILIGFGKIPVIVMVAPPVVGDDGAVIGAVIVGTALYAHIVLLNVSNPVRNVRPPK